MDPAFAGDRDDATRGEDGTNPARGLEEVVLRWLVRDRRPGPVHDPVAAANMEVVLLRAEEPQARSERQDGHQHERIGPAQVIEAVDGRADGQSLATVEAHPKIAPGQAGDDDARDPVPDGPAPRADGWAWQGRLAGLLVPCHRRGCQRDAR